MNIGKTSVPFKAPRDIPPLDGRVILVTGGNEGLGKQCILEYAQRQPALIWLAARNMEKAKAALDEIEKQIAKPVAIKIVQLDLSSMESVKAAAATVVAASDRLDILMLNAGVMAAPPGLTKDGYELQWGTNYLGHALLTKLLLPLLEKTANTVPDADVRIVALSSHGHMYAPKPEGICFDKLRSKADDLGPYSRYGQSKLATILWTKSMAQKYPQFTLTSIHPGVVRTNLMNNATGSGPLIRLLGKIANKIVTPVDQGARNQLWASVGKGVKSGAYYEPVGIAGTETDLAKDPKLGEKLWDYTEKELQQYFQ